MTIQHILLVEDEDAHLKLFKRNLARTFPGITFSSAADGSEALTLLETMDIDNLLIMVDLNMPIMGGKPFVEAVRAAEKWAQVPIAILTTSDYSRDLNWAKELNVKHYLVKPISPDQLAALLNDL